MDVLAAFLVVAAVASPISMPSPHQSPEQHDPAQSHQTVGKAHAQPPPAGIGAKEERIEQVLGAVERAANAYEQQAKASPWTGPQQPLTVFALFAALAAIGSAIAAGLNVRLIFQQRRSSYEQERARLVPELETPEPESEREIGFRFPYRLVNYGKTPAWITSEQTHIRRVVDGEGGPEPGGVLAGALRREEIAIAAGDKWSTYAYEELEPADKVAMMEGRLQFLLSGKVEYRDIFGKTHRAEFAWFILRWTLSNSREWPEGAWGSHIGPPHYWISD